MLKKNKFIVTTAALLLVIAVASPAGFAKPNEFEVIASHLQTKYKAKKVSIPFMWLARAAVKVVRPAGVKSFNITMFEDLKFSKETLDKEMRSAMRSSFGPEWSSVFNIRSQDGEQVYMYMKEDGRNIKIALVTIDKEDAAVIRATFSPEKLADFINDPKIFGISLSDNNVTKAAQKTDPQKGK